MMFAAVVSGFFLALWAPWFHRLMPKRSGWFLALLPLALTLFFGLKSPMIRAGQTLVEVHAWVPGLGVNLSFYLDGLSLIFALLISGIGTLIVIYSGGYLAGDKNLGRFYGYLLMFMASMLGTVLAGNTITLFIFWELTSLSSYFLIGYYHHRDSAREAALQALLVTGLGGLALLAGFLLLGWITGSFELTALLNRDEIVQDHSLYLPILILILLGAFTKSAQVPFHFWLPSAMEGPAPVSAYLHSATMVKAGVYLLLRLTPVLGDTAIWEIVLMVIGGTTMVAGAWLAIFQSDFKLILAYTTVNGLGTMVFLSGVGTPLAIQAALVFLIAHALYKGSLFLSAGVVDHEIGSRDVHRIKAIWRLMPVIGIATLLAAVSMAGLPPFIGFIGKELIYESLLKIHLSRWLLVAAALFANALLFVSAAIVAIRPIFGKTDDLSTKPHRVPLNLWLGSILPALLGLVLGLVPQVLEYSPLSAAVTAVLKQSTEFHLALWHGITPMLTLSLVTVAGGIVLYAGYDHVRRFIGPLLWISKQGPAVWYDWCLERLKNLAAWQTRILQSGYLYHYVLIIVVTTVVLVSTTLINRGGLRIVLAPVDVNIYEAAIVLLMLAAAFVALGSASRLSAIVAMGVIGYGLALIFMDFGAPDLAMTQFIIETMTVILFVLVIYRLPEFSITTTKKETTRNALVAAAGGTLMTILVLVALSWRQGSRLSGFFAENSLLLAHGRNIVNVIIVDFRGMDTLGEITVLSLAGVGVYTLLKLKPE